MRKTWISLIVVTLTVFAVLHTMTGLPRRRRPSECTSASRSARPATRRTRRVAVPLVGKELHAKAFATLAGERRKR